jgi:hypothetical protein
MNRLVLSALGLAGALALVAAPAAAQHRRGGEEGGGNGDGQARGQSQQSQPRQQSQPSQPRQQSQPSQPSQQSGQRVQGWRQPSQPSQPSPQTGQRVEGWRQQSQPAQAPPAPPRVDPGAVPRQGFERAVPRQGPERRVPRQDVDHAVPREDTGRAVARPGFNGSYDRRYGGYAAPRYIGPRYYTGRYYGPRYVGPTFTVAPRRFYNPYYIFHPRLSVGLGIWVGYPVTYYDPYYYPYDYYPYAAPAPGYVAPPVGSVSVQPDQSNTGGLSFAISPDTAEVWVDGNYFGTVGEYGPQSQPLGLPAGRHHVELREPGYQVSSFDVDIIAGQVIPYQGQLEQ